MSYSFTGLAYLILFFALGYFTYRLFQYWQKEKSLVAKLWLYFVAVFDLFLLSNVIGGLFFANNPSFLETAIKINSFIQVFAFAIMAYLILHIKFPKISPWLGFIPIFILGLIAAILTIFIQFNPSLTPNLAIDWGASPSSMLISVALLRFFLFFITFFPLIIINFQQFKISEDLQIKKKALGLALTLLFLAIAALIDLVFISIFKLGPIWRDVGFIIASIILFITLVLTQKPPPPTYVKRIYEEK